MARIAHIRTWTYITHRADWVDDADGLAGARPRHRGQALRRAARSHYPALCRPALGLAGAPAGRRRTNSRPRCRRTGEVRVEGAMSASSTGCASSPTRPTGPRAGCWRPRPTACCAARSPPAPASPPTPTTPSRSTPPVCCWRGGQVGRLVAGERLLSPRAEVLAGDFLEGDARERVRQRLTAYVRTEIERRLAPLFAASDLPLSGVGRGLAFQLSRCARRLPTAEAGEPARALAAADALRSRGRGAFRSREHLCRAAARAEALRFRALLWAVQQGRAVPRLPPARRLGKAIAVDPAAAGVVLRRARDVSSARLGMRPDRLERLAAAARLRAKGPFAVDSELASIAGIAPGDLHRVVGLTRLSPRCSMPAPRPLSRASAAAANSTDHSRPRPAREGHPSPSSRS